MTVIGEPSARMHLERILLTMFSIPGQLSVRMRDNMFCLRNINLARMHLSPTSWRD